MSETKGTRCGQRIVAVIDLGDHRVGDDRSFGGGAAVGEGQRVDPPHAIQRFANRRLAGQPLLLRMAARLSECQWVDEIYAVGCHLPDSMTQLKSPVIHPLSLPTCHLVERVGAIVDRTMPTWVFYVPANRPFVDAALVDGLLSKACKSGRGDYFGYTSSAQGRTPMERLGLAGEVCHADAIRRLRRNADRLSPGQTLAGCMEDAPGDYELNFVPVPDELDRCGLRFVIEDEHDWDEAHLVCESVREVDAGWQQVARLVSQKEHLRDATRSVDSI
ncbi:MobA-like NTP transferase domain protein [Stieleria neptunia]|uniref:MobA-like NTP transferase domain protein n=1 Tax=Stieleria neptunia TaxID=2527979 RepID=A0A518HRY5_9BACT|nr:NTP transferase domain-containing protein [Stieleria neptunia]QDV43548.1 MobA-like NTP transferase domain protein [Stieleria neptunia]